MTDIADKGDVDIGEVVAVEMGEVVAEEEALEMDEMVAEEVENPLETDLRLFLSPSPVRVSPPVVRVDASPQPVSSPRRSGRTTAVILKKRKEDEVERRLRQKCDEGLEVVSLQSKGKAVLAVRNFEAGSYVAEYSGKMLTRKVAKQVEAGYMMDPKIGSYIFEFQLGGKWFHLDATQDDGGLGRLINHSRISPNLLPKLVLVDSSPRLYFEALRDITAGQELVKSWSRATLRL